MEREALKLALEVLEQLQGGCTDHDDGTVEAITVWCPEVIDAIKEALAQPAQEPVCPECKAGVLYECVACSSNNYPPQQYANPMAWAVCDKRGEALELAQEPASVTYKEVQDSMNALEKGSLCQQVIAEELGQRKLYTAPPQRPWVGLTDKEIGAIYEQHHNQYGECESPNFGYERAILKKSKEKNNG